LEKLLSAATTDIVEVKKEEMHLLGLALHFLEFPSRHPFRLFNPWCLSHTTFKLTIKTRSCFDEILESKNFIRKFFEIQSPVYDWFNSSYLFFNFSSVSYKRGFEHKPAKIACMQIDCGIKARFQFNYQSAVIACVKIFLFSCAVKWSTRRFFWQFPLCSNPLLNYNPKFFTGLFAFLYCFCNMLSLLRSKYILPQLF